MAQSATRVFSESEETSAVRHTQYYIEDVIIGSGRETSLSIGQKLPTKLKVLKRALFLRKQNPKLGQQDLLLVTDFKNSTHDPSRQEDLFQVIEEHRNKVASINSKRDLENV